MSWVNHGSRDGSDAYYTRSQPLQRFEVWVSPETLDELQAVLGRAREIGGTREAVCEGELLRPFEDQWHFRAYVDAATAEELAAILHKHSVKVLGPPP